MRRLMLLRHAKTAVESPSGRDIDRRLDDRGMSDAVETGRWLSQQKPGPSRVLVSPAIRARQTWEIVAKELPKLPEMIEVEEMYDASVGRLLEAIHRHGGDASALMLVAHNPGLHELAIGLSERDGSEAMRALQDNFATSAVAVIDFNVDDWKDVHFQGGRLVELVSPKHLRNAASGAP